MTIFINPFCTAPGLMPPPINDAEPTIIKLGGCLTDEDERPFYSKEEWETRKRNAAP